MKKAILLGASIFMFSSFAANAGGFHLNFFSPAPIYRPAPVYVAQPRPVYVDYYPEYIATAYPRYNYEHNYWYYDDPYRHNKRDCRRHKHRRHHNEYSRYDHD
jgi:hypothetical protein